MKKGFLGGLFGCLGVGAAIIILIIIIAVIASANKSGSNNSSSGSGSSPKSAGSKVLLDMSGNGQGQSKKFKAPDDWDLEYSYDCSKFGTKGNFIVTVEGDAVDVAVNTLGDKGSDVSHQHQGGNIYLSMNSECEWHVTAKG